MGLLIFTIMEKTWTMPNKGPLNSRYGTHSIHSKRGRGWIWNGCAVCLATQPHQNTHALVHTTHMSSNPKDQLNAIATDQSFERPSYTYTHTHQCFPQVRIYTSVVAAVSSPPRAQHRACTRSIPIN